MAQNETDRLQRLLRQQESLRQVIESISSELELRPLLTRIVRHACELLDADNGTIGLVDAERDLVRTEAVYRMPPEELGAEMPRGVGLAGTVLATEQTYIPQRYGDVPTPTLPGLAQNAVIGLPIFWHGSLLGVFGLGSPPPRRFTDEDVEVLTHFARHAAIAIANARLFADTQTALGEMQLLYATGYRISAALDVDSVVEAYLKQVAAGGRYACTLTLYEHDGDGQRVAVVVQGRWSPAGGMSLEKARLPYTRDALDAPLDRGETIIIADVHADPRVSEELREIQRASRRPALAFIPLMARGRRIGLVVLSYPQVHGWADAELRPFQATAAQLATALDNRRQQQLFYERGQRLAALEERQKLARDLHDSVTQQLFGVTLIAQSLGGAWRKDPAEGERRVERLLDLSRAALAEMRALVLELRPSPVPDIDAPTLVENLRRYAVSLAGDALEVHSEGDILPALTPEQEAELFRVGQEALGNVVKHACARTVRLSLTSEGGTARLVIADDGRGFDPSASRPPVSPASGGMGLHTMRERAEALGGTFTIETELGRGTTLTAALPLATPATNGGSPR